MQYSAKQAAVRSTMLPSAAAAAPIADHERRVRLVLILLILAVSSSFFVAYAFFLSTSGFPGNDFFVFWSAARFLHQGGSLADAYDPAVFYAFEHGTDGHAPRGWPFLYPPHAALLFLPLAPLSLRAAQITWDALSLAVYLTGCWRVLKPRKALTGVALIAPASVANLIYGQTGLLTSGLTVLGLGLLQRAPIAAGVAFGLLSIKPQLALLPALALLLSGNRRAITAAALTTLSLVLASFAVFGAGSWADWVETLTGYSTAFSASPWHHHNGVTVYLTLLNLGAGRGLAIAAQGLVSVLVMWSTVRLLRRDQGELAIMATLTGLLLATPYALLYDLPLVSTVCLMLLALGDRSGFLGGELFMVAAAWCLPLLLVLSGGGTSALALSVLVGLLILILRRIAHGPPSQAGSTAAG